MSNLRTICGPRSVFKVLNLIQNPKYSLNPQLSSSYVPKIEPLWAGFSNHQWRTLANGTHEKSPYDTLGLEADANDDQVKLAYGRLVKSYLLDVYDGTWSLEEGETTEARFIKIQASYEFLIDSEDRREYDMENQVNPMKASQAWMAWLTRRRKAFDQRDDMTVAAWAEQQNREFNIRMRALAGSKIDHEEKASTENFNNTWKWTKWGRKKKKILSTNEMEERTKQILTLMTDSILKEKP